MFYLKFCIHIYTCCAARSKAGLRCGPVARNGPGDPLPQYIQTWSEGTQGVLRLVLASPYLNSFFLNFIFSLGRLFSDESSLNLDVFIAHPGPLGQMWRSLLFFHHSFILFFHRLLKVLGDSCLMIFYVFALLFRE